MGDADFDFDAHLASTAADYVALLEPGAELLPGAREMIRETLGRYPSQLAYGDSVVDAGGLSQVVRRPIFSPLRLREQHYLGPLTIVQVEWLRRSAGELPLPHHDQGYAVALRCAEVALHIPQPLSVIRSGQFERDGSEWVQRELAADGIAASVEPRPDGTRRVRYPVQGSPLVSIIIPTRGTSGSVAGRESTFVVDAVRSIADRSTWQNLEFVVVADDATPQKVIEELIAVAGEKLRLVRWSKHFDFSAKINRGAAFAAGEYLLLLNDDVELVSPDWIETMVGLAQQTGVGLVGALLLFEDGTVQHGGHLYRQSWAGHIAPGWNRADDDLLASLRVTREVSGVTAACALVSAQNFERVGGLSREFPGNYNDVDFSLKVRSLGLSAIWSPDAVLHHYESKSRDAEILPHEIAALRRRWGSRLLLDPYWTDER